MLEILEMSVRYANWSHIDSSALMSQSDERKKYFCTSSCVLANPVSKHVALLLVLRT